MPTEQPISAAIPRRLNPLARSLREGHEFSVTEQHTELVAAVRELAQVLNAGPRSATISSFLAHERKSSCSHGEAAG
ncbi:hypothetical protein FHE74_10555 [Corynebacterium tapiri]|uniref:Uncharacterized protein n=1 Tax=Corynebacterium tapiri TaxID=1448266 RepID=A0A5C4U159_9CORY|nr:hypothetical protein FHE74_10555 [Corynebacterium tapiri]